MVNSIRMAKTAEELTKWVTSAKLGHRICYYRGWLMRDKLRLMPFSIKTNEIYPEFRLANKAWDFYEMGVVELFQKRLGDEDYLYIAVKK